VNISLAERAAAAAAAAAYVLLLLLLFMGFSRNSQSQRKMRLCETCK